MRFKKTILPGILTISLIGSGIAAAAPSGTLTNTPTQPSVVNKTDKAKPALRNLTEQQRQEVQSVMQQSKQEMKVLKQQARNLTTQLRGKLATSGTQYSDVSALVEQINAVHNKMFVLMTKTQLTVFQKTGVLLKVPHKGGKMK